MSWTDNIPEQGVLCKFQNSSIILIAKKHNERMVCSSLGTLVSIDDVKPIESNEWWDFAPWNYDMDSRPKNTRSLIKNDAGNITTACCSICERDIAWLPLPESKQ